jgi:hypothetical protein
MPDSPPEGAPPGPAEPVLAGAGEVSDGSGANASLLYCVKPQGGGVEDTPRRIQRQRRAGWRKPPGAVCVTRPSRWANPFAVRPLPSDHGRRRWTVVDTGDRVPELRESPRVFSAPADATMYAVLLYGAHTGIEGAYELDVARATADLRGRDLACWCPLPGPGERDWCHAALLLAAVNRWGRWAA